MHSNDVKNKASDAPIEGFLWVFDQNVQQSRNRECIEFGASVLNYAQVAALAAHYRAALKRKGIVAGDVVAVSIPRTQNLIPLLVAIWSLRAAYVPIDPTYPLERQTYIFGHSDAKVLICEPDNKLMAGGCEVVILSDVEQLGTEADNETGCEVESTDLFDPTYSESDLAYIIYTSGSTGVPKGVAVNQGNLFNFLFSMSSTPGMNSHDCLLAVTTISFDIHILELFLPLFVGAKIVLASSDESRDYEHLQRLVDTNDVSIMQATPSGWRLLLNSDWVPKRRMKVLVGGEALPKSLVSTLLGVSSELWNMYGPTETTVWSSCHQIRSDEQVLIGSPISNTEMYVVSDDLKVVEDGVEGELLIGGKGVSIGYYKEPIKTAESFIRAPDISDSTLYKTGDLVVSHNGLFQYISRKDNQLKVRGYRVEAGEVESLLDTHPQINQSTVVVCNKEDTPKLVAFYVGERVDSRALHAFCRSALPGYMVPQLFTCLSEFPMTDNLKVDRKVLMDLNCEFDVDDLGVLSETSSVVAADDLELSLLVVWKKILNCPDIELDSDFFEFGGDSLLALQLVREMHKKTGLDFPQSSIFKYPTIRLMKQSIGRVADEAASVVRLNKVRDGEPVFCLSGVQIYKPLAELYGQTNPVLGVYAKQEVAYINAERQGNSASFVVDELVDVYVEAIVRQGDFRSVSLVGLSFGGIIALEVAAKLIQKGIKVSSVVLLDTYLPTALYRSYANTTVHLWRMVKSKGFTALLMLALNKVGENVTKLLNRYDIRTQEKSDKQIRDRAYGKMSLEYDSEGKSFDFDVLLIKATCTNFGAGIAAEQDYGLGHIVKGSLTIKKVSAGHVDLLETPAVGWVHGIIQDYCRTRGLN